MSMFTTQTSMLNVNVALELCLSRIS